MYFAMAGLLLGGVALVLDLGNRLFGSYVRSLTGTTSRVLLVVVLPCLLATPALICAVNPDSTWARYLLWAFGVLGVLIFFHFLFPCGWGIRKSRDSVLTESDAPLAPGVTFHDAVIRALAVPEGLEELRFLLLSDLHCNSARHLALIRECVDNLRDPEPDFVFVLGDFGEKKSLLPAVIEALGRLPGRLGRFSVRGNHDFEGGRDGLVKQLLAEHAIRLLANEVEYVPEVGVSIVGLELPWNKAPLPSVDSPGFVIGLSHTPDNLPALAELGVRVAFAGHTHGGMARLPLVGPLLVPSKYGRLLRGGWFRCGGSVMYVTRGLGYLPGRLGGTGEVLRVVAHR